MSRFWAFFCCFFAAAQNVAFIHPLPASLINLTISSSDDYFSAITPIEFGYLIWSSFPIKVYIEPIAPNVVEGTGEDRRWRTWERLARKAFNNWSVYLPLTIVDGIELSDIEILREYPPTSSTRAKAGQTRYCLYQSKDRILRHKMIIKIPPNLAEYSLQSTIEHELGHALGIWGHSDKPSDRMYASQSPQAASISPRDINTLKKIYQQPTKLGWPVSYSSQDSTKINSLTGSWREKPKSNSSCFQ